LSAFTTPDGRPLRKIGAGEVDEDTSVANRAQGYATMLDRWLGLIQAGGGGGVGGGTADVADWDITKVRYFFLDGDAGNDAHIGYIDATPGTDFTSRAADVAAVAIKTTSRLAALTPKVGAGRMMVRLFKPRSAGAVYDHLTPGDGLGTEDRSELSGYAILRTRGSDLTNSATDNVQLGFVTGIVGPNGDGSFTVASATPGADGDSIALTGATLPASWTLPGYRLHALTAGNSTSPGDTSTVYGATRWGNILGAGADTLTAWAGPISSVVPGDKVWLEVPGVVLDSFKEAASAVGTPTSIPLAAAGMTLVSLALIGCSDDPVACQYSNMTVKAGGSVVSSNNPRTSAMLVWYYTDETGNTLLTNGMGIAAPSVCFNGGEFSAVYSSFSDGASGSASAPSSINADDISISETSLQTAVIQGGAEDLSLSNLNHGGIVVAMAGQTEVSSMRGITLWNPQIVVEAAGGAGGGAYAVAFQDMHNLRIATEGVEPASPGILLKNGQYTATLDFGNESALSHTTISAGNGVRVEYNGDGNQFTLVNYDSLLTTGFEVIGGQKVVAMATLVADSVNYAGGVFPCPRGTPMKIVNVPGCGDYPGPSPCGLVVVGKTDVGGDQAWFLSGSLEPQNIIGATLTNYANNADLGGGNTGGWVVVGNDSVMVLQVDSVSAIPAVGVPVFAAFHDEFSSGLTGGCSVTEYQADGDFQSLCLGHVLPVGIRGTFVTVAWKPSHLASQMRTIWSPISVTSNTDPSDVQGMFFTVEAGATYSVHGRLHVSTGAGVNNGGIKLAFTGDASATVKCNLLMAFEENSTGLTVSLPTLVSTGDASCVSYAGSSSTYDVVINGSFVADSSGVLYLRFSQALSKTVASQITFGVLVATRNR
jgi:hypothetical protein